MLSAGIKTIVLPHCALIGGGKKQGKSIRDNFSLICGGGFREEFLSNLLDSFCGCWPVSRFESLCQKCRNAGLLFVGSQARRDRCDQLIGPAG